MSRPLKAKLILTLEVDGRPFWMVAREVNIKTAVRMGDPEYLKALQAAGNELTKQIGAYKKSEQANPSA